MMLVAYLHIEKISKPKNTFLVDFRAQHAKILRRGFWPFKLKRIFFASLRWIVVTDRVYEIGYLGKLPKSAKNWVKNWSFFAKFLLYLILKVNQCFWYISTWKNHQICQRRNRYLFSTLKWWEKLFCSVFFHEWKYPQSKFLSQNLSIEVNFSNEMEK